MRGRAKVFGGEWVVRSAGNASHIHCAVPFFLCPKRNRRGRAKVFGGKCVVRLAGVRRRCVEE